MRLRILALAGHLNPPPATVCQARKPLRPGNQSIEALVCLGLIASRRRCNPRLPGWPGAISSNASMPPSWAGSCWSRHAPRVRRVSPREETGADGGRTGRILQNSCRPEASAPARRTSVTVSWREPNGQKSLVIER